MTSSRLFTQGQEQASRPLDAATSLVENTKQPTSPSKHTVLTINTIDGQLPLLFVELDGEGQLLKEQAAYARVQLSGGKTHQKIANGAEAIGRFWDWVVLAEASTEVSASTLPQILARFTDARFSGTLDTNGSDKYGLNWKPVKRSTVNNDLREISAFSDFVSNEFGYAPLNPRTESGPQPGGSHSFFKRGNHISTDLFTHLVRSRKTKPTYQVTTKRKGSMSFKRGQGTFPLELINDLIKAEKSISKKMIYLEFACGGLRISEPLHRFVTDVLPGRTRPILFPRDAPSELPLVILADPIESLYTDSLNTNSKTNRRQFLLKNYGLIPRNEIKNGSLRAGWKGMLYDNSDLKVSQIYWSNYHYAKLYFELYKQLMHIRQSVPKSIRDSHPYLYIVDNPKIKQFGQQLTIGNLEKSFARACKKIGLIPYRNKASPHGLRHGYKKQLEALQLSASEIQVCMHHKSISSQAAYALPDSKEINKKLSKILN